MLYTLWQVVIVGLRTVHEKDTSMAGCEKAMYVAGLIEDALAAGVKENRIRYVFNEREYGDWGGATWCCAIGMAYVSEHMRRGFTLESAEKHYFESRHLGNPIVVVASYTDVPEALVDEIERLHLHEVLPVRMIIEKLRSGELNRFCCENPATL